MEILITGATGFVGRQLASALLKTRPLDTISALLLPNEPIPAAFLGKIAIHRGDLRYPDSIRQAVSGKDMVFHLAGFISYWVMDKDTLHAVNVEGVRAIVEACIEFKVKRLIHVSSVGAIGFHKDGTLADEDTPFNWPESFSYMTTKRDGQMIVLDAARNRGLDAVIINPASIMGPGDPMKNSAHNVLYSKVFSNPFFFGSFGGGLAIVDVRDLANTILAAAERGRKGESYLAVGANVPYTQVLRLMTNYAGKYFIPLVVPSSILTAAGWGAELISSFSGKKPLITLSYGQLSGWAAYYSSEKSIRELGVSYRTLEQTIADGCEYYVSTFMKNQT